jgi:hypothetical protein
LARDASPWKSRLTSASPGWAREGRERGERGARLTVAPSGLRHMAHPFQALTPLATDCRLIEAGKADGTTTAFSSTTGIGAPPGGMVGYGCIGWPSAIGCRLSAVGMRRIVRMMRGRERARCCARTGPGYCAAGSLAGETCESDVWNMLRGRAAHHAHDARVRCDKPLPRPLPDWAALGGSGEGRDSGEGSERRGFPPFPRREGGRGLGLIGHRHEAHRAHRAHRARKGAGKMLRGDGPQMLRTREFRGRNLRYEAWSMLREACGA